MRIVSWFSAGAASAVASRLAVDRDPFTVVAYCDPGSEHIDNYRFISEIEGWLGVPITMLKNPDYSDTWEVFDKTRYLVGPMGARCTIELKKVVRREFQHLGDLQVFGFTFEEKVRAERFRRQNLEVDLWCPLIEAGLTKNDCKNILRDARIELPAMYRLGYKNNNCIGCVKGQAGYWNKIRIDFPEVFDRMAKVERRLNAAINKTYAGDGKRKLVFLDELSPVAGRYLAEPDIECGPLCNLDEESKRRNGYG